MQVQESDLPLPELTQAERDANRQAYLEYLYDRDGRHDPAHPMRGLWTGLAAARRQELAAPVAERIGWALMADEVGKFHLETDNARYYSDAASRTPEQSYRKTQ